jgi:hypothetical protein
MTWIKAVAETASYRRMYTLASEIAASDSATREMRHTARRVVRALKPVIDKPIADAIILTRARKRFAELAKTVANVAPALTETSDASRHDQGASKPRSFRGASRASGNSTGRARAKMSRPRMRSLGHGWLTD